MTSESSPHTPWFDAAFDAHYATLYAHRDDRSAQHEIRHVLARLPAGGRALDLACGEGRHSRALRRYGYQVVSFDRSKALLAQGVNKSALAAVRGDMRALPFADGAFALTLQMFTAFGYFPTRSENLQVLTEVARTLRPRGAYVLDYLDATWTKNHLLPRSERRIHGELCIEERSLDGDRLKKRVRWFDADGCTVRDYEESIMLFDPEELPELLKTSGLCVQQAWGDFQGAAYGAGSRCVLLARKIS